MRKLSKARATILNLIERDAIAPEHAEAKLLDIKAKETDAQVELDKARSTLDALHTAAGIESHDRFWHHKYCDPDTNLWNPDVVSSWEDRRALIKDTFEEQFEPLADGRPAGIYIYPAANARAYRPKGWKFVVKGRVLGVVEEYKGEVYEHYNEIALVAPRAWR